jgi:hypothetical protein
MIEYNTWFTLYVFVLSAFMILGGMSDAWMWRKKGDTDGVGHDFPNWLRNLMHVFWLGGFSMKFLLLPVFGYYSPVGVLPLLFLTIFLAGGLSFLWDMTYSQLKHGIWNASLEYWWYTKRTVIWSITIPEIKIGWKSPKAVWFSYYLRMGFVVIAYIIGVCNVN